MSQLLLAHLSDPHLGESPDAPRGQHEATLFGMQLLTLGFRRVRPSLHAAVGIPRDVPLVPIVSGDLTVRGRELQFQQAFSFLTAQADVPSSSGEMVRIGLGAPIDTRHVTPGNHDHWRSGGRDVFRLPAHDPDLALRLPLEEPLVLRHGDLRVEVVRLDSCSGLAGREYDRFQGGALDEASLDRVRDWKGEPGALRVVLMHHDLTRLGAFPSPLKARSRRELVRACHASHVAAVLTGHRHAPVHRTRRTLDGASVRELRSTTCLYGVPHFDRHGFLVHHLQLEGEGAVRWRTYTFLYGAEDRRMDLRLPDGRPLADFPARLAP